MKAAFLLLGFVFLQVRAEAPSLAAMKAALPGLKGQARLEALLELANRLESNAPQEAMKHSVEGAALAAQAGDKAKEAVFLSTTAFCCTQTGDFAQGIDCAKRALALGAELGDKERVARVHNTLGITYTYMGAYSQALSEGYEALRIREELGQIKGIAQSINLIGVIYHHSGQYEKAIDCFSQIFTRIGDQPEPRIRMLAMLNTGFAQYKLGRLSAALKNHQEALALSERTHETAFLPYAYLNLGMTYSDLKDFAKAGHYLRLARAQYRELGQKHGLIQALNAMARMDLLSGRYAEGIPRAKEGAELAEKINSRDELKTSYELISDLYGKSGNIAESYRYYKMAVQTKESIFTVQESNRIAEASMKIVTIQKDNEIEALKKERVISALKLEKQRYFSFIFLSSIGFLGAIILMLGLYNRKMGQTRKSLENLNADLSRINGELQDKIIEVKTLSGLLPICCQCKKIRDDEGYWNQLEGYISERTSATFSHGICPHCAEELYPEVADSLRARTEGSQPNLEPPAVS